MTGPLSTSSEARHPLKPTSVGFSTLGQWHQFFTSVKVWISSIQFCTVLVRMDPIEDCITVSPEEGFF